MTRLYVLSPFGGRRFGTRFAYADILDPQITGDPKEYGICPCCGDGLGPRPWLPPHRIALSSKRYPDFLWGAGFELMVSDRFRGPYEQAGLRGIQRFDAPAEVVRVGRKRAAEAVPPPPNYHYVRLDYRGADLDDDLSGARRKEGLCHCCRQGIDAVERIVMREGSWTGGDMFEALGLPGDILVTERLKAMVEEHGLTNAEFTAGEEYCRDWERYPFGRPEPLPE